MKSTLATSDASVRLDVWLWAARFYRTRALAKQAIDGGRVEVNGASGKPARPLHTGDRLRIARDEERFEIEVLGISERRGAAAIAQALYRETEAGRTARDALREARRLTGAGYAKPEGRPDKHARRRLRDLKQGDG